VRNHLTLLLALVLPNCGGGGPADPSPSSSGGAPAQVGGSAGTGGSGALSPTGGKSSGSGGSGGIAATGGSISTTGGMAPNGGRGGSPSTGGATNQGGSAPVGGGTSGSPGTGGTSGGAASGGSGGSTPVGGARGKCTPPATYRNLFNELLQKSETDVKSKVDAAFQSLFHGGNDKTIYYESGDNAYILDVASNDVRSEGMSYGMMVAVQLDKKEEFDKLWRWARQYMRQPNGLFGWQANTNGTLRSTGSAPDGEEYIATALIFAAKRWGDGAAPLNYSVQAADVLDAQITANNFNRDNKLVRFVTGSNYSDPSYVLPAFYEVWACFDSKNRTFWADAVGAGRAFLQKTTHPTTGLAPYLANFDGSNYDNSNFNSDSWRVVGNIMMDHHLFGEDPWQTTFAAKFAAFFKSAPPNADEFRIDGTVVREWEDGASKGLISQNALVAFGVPAADGTPFLKVLWDMPVPTGQYRYYDGLLYALALLHASGNFRLWY
jgi:endo-1,4-beta-D-glucanase Y